MIEEKSPIVDIGKETIDIRHVVRVGSLGGDPDYLRYVVYFEGGTSIEVYQIRTQSGGYPVTQMKREDFISLWRSFNSLTPK